MYQKKTFIGKLLLSLIAYFGHAYLKLNLVLISLSTGKCATQNIKNLRRLCRFKSNSEKNRVMGRCFPYPTGSSLRMSRHASLYNNI